MAIAITLKDDIDISRGDMIARSTNLPQTSQDLIVMLYWLNNAPAKPRAKYTIMHTSNEQKAIIKGFMYKIDINTLKSNPDDTTLCMNDICKVKKCKSGLEERIDSWVQLMDQKVHK